jgi:hypothetical protein
MPAKALPHSRESIELQTLARSSFSFARKSERGRSLRFEQVLEEAVSRVTDGK